METIGGYRVVRRLGGGSRSEVWLGRDITAHDAGERDGVDRVARVESALPSLVALKLFRTDADTAGVDREMRALERVDCAHVVPLLDATVDGESQPCLVMPRLHAGGLSRLLAARDQCAPGELVTLLVSIARGVMALHAGGVAHGGLRASKVLFGWDGTPVLIGGGSITLVDPRMSPSARRDHEALTRDREQLATLARELSARVGGHPRAERLRDWLDDEHWRKSDFAGELVARAFDIDEPEPLQGVARGGLSATGAPVNDQAGAEARGYARAGAPGERSGRPEPRHPKPRRPKPRRPQREGTRGQRRERSFPRLRVTEVSDSLRATRHRVRGLAAGVRPRFQVLAAAGVLAVAAVIGLAFVQAQTEAPAAGSVTGAPEEAEASPPSPASGTPDSVLSSEAVGLTGDDPVTAARTLMAMRDDCYRRLSLTCLEGSVQPDSAAWDADVARLSAIVEGSSSYDTGWHDERAVAVVDTMGGVVLLEIGPPPAGVDDAGDMATASVLIIRTEAGWRIRDVFSG